MLAVPADGHGGLARTRAWCVAGTRHWCSRGAEAGVGGSRAESGQADRPVLEKAHLLHLRPAESTAAAFVRRR